MQNDAALWRLSTPSETQEWVQVSRELYLGFLSFLIFQTLCVFGLHVDMCIPGDTQDHQRDIDPLQLESIEPCDPFMDIEIQILMHKWSAILFSPEPSLELHALHLQ